MMRPTISKKIQIKYVIQAVAGNIEFLLWCQIVNVSGAFAFRGIHPHWEKWSISPLFQISPYFLKISLTPSKIFKIWPFQKKILMTFFSHHPQIYKFEIFPLYYRIFIPFPPHFGKIFHSPYFAKFPPDFVKFPCFVHAFCDFPFPLLWPWCIYASHNARTICPCTLVCVVQFGAIAYHSTDV